MDGTIETRPRRRTGRLCSRSRVTWTTAVAALTLTVGLVAAGCAGGDEGNDPSDAQTAGNGDVFNDADVAFATAMVPHHAQALQMVSVADEHTLDPEVRELTESIRAAQTAEIETLVDWLSAWDQEIPRTSMDHGNAGHDLDDMEGMDGAEDMPGMMSADEMQELSDASDAEFQDMWLQMMIEHHQGAIEMAQDEQENGVFGAALALAEDIEAAQKAEIETMEDMLG
jgi:uncharacterized protein (DUF305 family)